MKKIIQSIVLFFSVFILTACSQSTHEELQENEWNILIADWSGTAQFFENDLIVSGELGLSTNYEYELNDDETEFKITEKDDDKGSTIYSIENKNGEYHLKPIQTNTNEELDEIDTVIFTPKKSQDN